MELMSETLVCVNHLIQVSARDDPAESYAIVCSQQWTGDLNVSRMYCTIPCKTGRGPVVRIPTALTCLCISTTWQNEWMHEWMTLLISYVNLYISFWYRNVYVDRLLSATSCLGHYVTSVFRHLLPKSWNFLAQLISSSSKVGLWFCLIQFELWNNIMNCIYHPCSFPSIGYIGDTLVTHTLVWLGAACFSSSQSSLVLHIQIQDNPTNLNAEFKENPCLTFQ